MKSYSSREVMKMLIQAGWYEVDYYGGIYYEKAA